jgi:hypothetical protein
MTGAATEIATSINIYLKDSSPKKSVCYYLKFTMALLNDLLELQKY